MLVINYISKEIKPLEIGKIKALIVSYQISKDGMNNIASLQSNEYKIQRFFMYKNWGTFELVVDNIENGKVIQGGLIDDKYVLNCYDVKEGLSELLTFLNNFTV